MIPPGGSGKLVARTTTSPVQSGRITKTVTVTTDTPGQSTFRLTFTADVQRLISVLPSLRVYLTATEGEGGQQRVLLRRTDGSPLAVSDVSVRGSGIRVSSEEVRNVPPEGRFSPSRRSTETPWGMPSTSQPQPEARAGDVVLEVATTPDITAGRYSGFVTMSTNLSGLPRFELPYTLRVRPAIEVRPGSVHLGYSDTGEVEGAAAIVTLHDADGESFAVTALHVSHPNLLRADLVAGDEPAPQHIIRIGLQGTADDLNGAPLVNGWVAVSTGDPHHPRVEIPVVVSRVQRDGRRSAGARTQRP